MELPEQSGGPITLGITALFLAGPKTAPTATAAAAATTAVDTAAMVPHGFGVGIGTPAIVAAAAATVAPERARLRDASIDMKFMIC